MKGCDHDLVYSGQTNMSQKFQHICRKCGECGWSDSYSLAQVNFYEFCHLRALHGWPIPPNGATLLYLDTAPKAKPKKKTTPRWWYTWSFGAISNTYAVLLLGIWCGLFNRFAMIEATVLAITGTLMVYSWYRVLRG